MTDNEKRAHDLAVKVLPYAIQELNMNYYLFDGENIGSVNPDIAPTYLELYESFLGEFISLP